MKSHSKALQSDDANVHGLLFFPGAEVMTLC